MKRASYRSELAELPATYNAARNTDPAALRSALLRLAAGPARMVGTGGTLALARLAADLHEQTSGQPAYPVTPLELLGAPLLQRAGVLLFSARARHPDAHLVLDHFVRDRYEPAVLVTHRDPDELADLRGRVEVVSLPRPALPEGFLATNSVLAMATALIAAAHGSEALPAELPEPSGQLEVAPDRPLLLVAYAPPLAAAAIDIETRCSELGLLSVQLSDLRNLAHGRHTGLGRRAAETTVLVLTHAASGALGDAVTGALVSSGAEVVRWHANQLWPAAVLEHLVASMRLTASLGDQQRVDPARPSVPAFGRRLYNLPIKRLLTPPPVTGVQRKLLALGAVADPALTRRYDEAFDTWRGELASQPLGGVVFDYDGTICATARRYEPPTGALADALVRLVDAGLTIGFASGRGGSLHEALRAWLPREHWQQVHLGLYNGAVLTGLVDDLADIAEPTPLMRDVCARLAEAPFADLVKCHPRSGQVSVRLALGAAFPDGRLARLVADTLATHPALAVKVVSSGHSVDVIAPGTSKTLVLDRVTKIVGDAVLAVGDQGDSGGNDYELLAATPWSLTVDRCSADPTRCWFVDPAGRRGPDAVLPALRAMRLRRGRAHLDVSTITGRPRA